MSPHRHWLRILPAALVALAALSLSPARTAAQQPLRGVVTDSLGNPVSEAEVFLSRRTESVRTDRFGRFQLDGVPRGDYWVFVRKLGFAPARHSVTVPYREPVRTLDVMLRVLPQEMDSVLVSASGYGTGVGSAAWFNNDVKAWGRLITRDRIERSRAPRFSSLLQQYIPNYPFDAYGVNVALTELGLNDPSLNYRAYASTLMGNRVPPCVPAFSINGGYPVYGFDPDMLPIESIEALEFFRSGAGTPLGLQFITPEGTCGVVRIWLRDIAS